MKKINQLFIVAIATVTFFAVTGAKSLFIETGFNGKWVIDTAKSNLGGVPLERAAPTIMTLTQTADAVTFERVFQSLLEPSKLTLTVDGKALETKKDANQSIKTLKISEDKKVLTVVSKVHMTPAGHEPWDYTRTETYALGNDGATLTLTRVAVTPDGTETVKAHYKRAK